MSKRNLIFSIIIVAGLATAAWMVFNQSSALKIPLVSKGARVTGPSEVTVGYGWSVKPDVKQAIQEAVISASEEFNGSQPDYAILLSNEQYDSKVLVKELKRLWPNTRVHGGTTMYGKYTRDGYHYSPTGSLALMAISSPKIKVGVGGAEVGKISAQAAGKKAIETALKDAGKEGEKPQVIYIIGSFTNEQGLIEGIESVVGKDVPIVGGSAFDDAGVGNWSEFVNDEVYTNGVALTAFFTDLTVGTAYESGYEKTKFKGTITKAKGAVIYEINNRPALEVYDEWSGGLVTSVRADSKAETITEIVKTALLPLAKVLKGTNGEVHYIPMHPYFWNLKDKTVSTGVNVEVGDEITIMHGTWEANVNHAVNTSTQALENSGLKKGEAYFAIYTYCLGKMQTIPAEERNKIPLLVNDTLGDIPFIAGNTGGEQGYLRGVGNEHAGLSNTMIIFGPKK